nr:MAG TPA: protein of unknown function (DUF5361) [Caudoviricetes sp.]
MRLRNVGRPEFTWGDLRAIVENSLPGSVLGVAQGYPWSPEMYMTANVFDALQIANWQRTGRGNSDRPKPIPRPNTEDKDTQHYGSDPIPLSDFKDWWDNN